MGSRKTETVSGAIEELALFGGAPEFEEPLHVGRPNIGDRRRLLARLDEMLDRRWLSNGGPLVQEFERRIEDLVGVKHCIAVCNATVGLEVAIRALGLSGEVIVPSFTFVATAHALQWQHITPVFADIDPQTHTIDPVHVERLITPRTTGILGVHLFGRGCDVDALTALARRHGLKLLFDAAHAFFCTHQGKRIGGFGEAEVFSFHATKFINSFEGGAVVTDDGELARRVRMMQNFGFQDYDEVVSVGLNGKMTEACAAMGLTSLESMAEFLAINRANYLRYRERLSGIPGIRLSEYDERETGNYQYVIVEIDAEGAGLNRDLLLALLQAERVLARRYFFPSAHRMEPYRTQFPDAGLALPNTRRLSAQVLSLPTGSAVDGPTIDRVCGLVRFAVARNAEVVGAWRRLRGGDEARVHPHGKATE